MPSGGSQRRGLPNPASKPVAAQCGIFISSSPSWQCWRSQCYADPTLHFLLPEAFWRGLDVGGTSVCQWWDGKGDVGHCTGPLHLTFLYSSKIMHFSPFLKRIFVSSPHKCLTCPWRDSGCCILLESHCDLSPSSLMTSRAHPKSSSHFPVLFPFPIWDPASHFPLFPPSFSPLSVLPPHSCAVAELLMQARSGGSHAVLAIWDGQLLLEPPDPHGALERSHSIPSQLLLPLHGAAFLWATIPSPTQGLPSWAGSSIAGLKPFRWKAPSWWIYSFTPFPLLHMESESKQEKYENLEDFNASAHYFEHFSFCYWNTFQSAEFRNISAHFFQGRFIYSLSTLFIFPGCFAPETITPTHTLLGELWGVSCWLHGCSFTCVPTQGILQFCDLASCDFILAWIGGIVIYQL